ncbi:MAG TPA: ABC transporter permease subunit [Actinopolymorphaceae bacterium]
MTAGGTVRSETTRSEGVPRPLSLGTEIRRQWSRRRTHFALGLMAALPVILVLAFVLGSDDDDGGTSFVDRATFGAANFTVFTLVVSAAFLLVVVIALFFGDTIASEASWGSLRYLLAIPVPRARLLGIKLVVSVLSSAVALVILTVSSLLVGAVAFGWHPLRSPYGDDIPADAAVGRITIMVAYIAVTLLVVAAFGFLLSVRTDAPLAAVGGAVLVFVVSEILDQVEALGDLRSLLPTHYSNAWQGLFSDPIQWESMAKGGVVALGYATVFFAVAWRRFLRADVLS